MVPLPNCNSSDVLLYLLTVNVRLKLISWRSSSSRISEKARKTSCFSFTNVDDLCTFPLSIESHCSLMIDYLIVLFMFSSVVSRFANLFSPFPLVSSFPKELKYSFFSYFICFGETLSSSSLLLLTQQL